MKTIAFKNRNQWLFLSKICAKSIKAVPRGSHYALPIEDDQVDKVLDIVSRRIATPLTDISVIDYSVAMDMAHRKRPIAKVVDDSETAKKFDIKPWHHLHFLGDIIAVVVWDTRVVDKVIKIDELTNEDFANLRFTNTDNHKSLKIDKLSSNDMQLVTVNADRITSSLTNEQFKLIGKDY